MISRRLDHGHTVLTPLNHSMRPTHLRIQWDLNAGPRKMCDDYGGRTAWSKTWYQSPEVWSSKVNFGHENVWPSPSTYDEKLRIGGNHQTTRNRYPAFTMGHRAKINLGKPGAELEPGPLSYSRDTADRQVYHRAPTIIHSFRPRNSDLWGHRDVTPGPGAYSPEMTQIKRHQPAFSLGRASREGLEPLLGPFASS